jgi:hypothetical protein
MTAPRTVKTYRYYVRAPGGAAIHGFDRAEVAAEVALEFGAGAEVVDTLAQAYHPMLQRVELADGGKRLVYGAVGGWDTGRFTVDRDLVEAVKKGSAGIVHAFLAKGASASARDDRGGPALHWAVGRGSADVVTLLITQGADLAAVDSVGQTARQLADRKGRTDIAALLAAAGAP